MNVGMTYTYDADGNRVKKSSGSSGLSTGTVGIISESDLTGEKGDSLRACQR